MSSTKSFSDISAQRYAAALYEIAMEDSMLDKVENEVNILSQLLKLSSEFRSIISNPSVGKKNQTKVIIKIAEKGNFSEIFKKFLGLLVFKRRIFYLQKIIDNFLNIISLKKGEIQAKLMSSKELSNIEVEQIQKELSENYKAKIKLAYKYDPDLLGGLIIQVGSVMIDASLKTKLHKLEQKMVEV